MVDRFRVTSTKPSSPLLNYFVWKQNDIFRGFRSTKSERFVRRRTNTFLQLIVEDVEKSTNTRRHSIDKSIDHWTWSSHAFVRTEELATAFGEGRRVWRVLSQKQSARLGVGGEMGATGAAAESTRRAQIYPLLRGSCASAWVYYACAGASFRGSRVTGVLAPRPRAGSSLGHLWWTLLIGGWTLKSWWEVLQETLMSSSGPFSVRSCRLRRQQDIQPAVSR